MLQYVLESLARVDSLAETIVATSTDPSDDSIADFCERRGTPCFRGTLDNVAERYLQAARAHGFSAFARVSGDSPLLDPRLVLRALALFAEREIDLATNVYPRTWPPGMSVEVLQSQTFGRVVGELSDPGDREHVTSYYYRHAEQFRIVNFGRDVPRLDVHLSVDTLDDFERLAGLISRMSRPHWEYSLDEVLRLCDLLPVPRPLAPPQVTP